MNALSTSIRPARDFVRLESATMICSILTRLRALLCVFAVLFLQLAAGQNAYAGNDGAFVSQVVPTTMVAGAVYDVNITMSNTGTTTWTSAAPYFIGSRNPENNMTWGGRVSLPSSIAPGAQASFSFQVTAPTTPGSYNFQWQLLQEYVEWFGPATPNVAVTVRAPVNGSQLMGVSVPSSMTQGQTYNIAVTMKNTGEGVWPAGSAYRLGSTSPLDTTIWGPKRVDLVSSVAPGGQYTFSFPVTAPAAGSYNMGWGMVQEFVQWFGPSSSSAVTVNASQAPTMSVSRTPSPMTAGQSYSLSWSSTNATSVSRTCTSSGTGYTVSDAPALSGTAAGTASSAWVGYPSTCTWRATGAYGTATFTESMVTNAAPTSEVVTYIHTDGLGSPIARTSSTGALVSRTRYEPYGLTASGATPTIGFTGHVNDAETGLVYMQQRYYDPVGARFLSIDPVTTDANTGGSFNRYAYASNNPYKYIDPDGRFAAHAAAFAIGFAIDAGVQHWVEGKSWSNVNYKESAIAGVGAALTGSVGGRLAQEALKGTITATRAVAATSAVGGAAGAGGSVAGNLVNGEKISAGKAAIGFAGGALGAAVGGTVDNAAAKLIGTMSAVGGMMSHVADATRTSVNFGSNVRMGESAGQAVGKASADTATATGQKVAEKKAGL